MTRKEEREWAWFDGQFRRHYPTMLRLTARQLRDPARAEERRPAGDLRVPVPHAPDPRPAALPGAVGGAGRPRRIRGEKNFLKKF